MTQPPEVDPGLHPDPVMHAQNRIYRVLALFCVLFVFAISAVVWHLVRSGLADGFAGPLITADAPGAVNTFPALDDFTKALLVFSLTASVMAVLLVRSTVGRAMAPFARHSWHFQHGEPPPGRQGAIALTDDAVVRNRPAWDIVLRRNARDGTDTTHVESADSAEKRRQRLAASVFYSAREAIMVTDEKGEIVATNPAFSLMTGYREDQVVGNTPRILKSGRHSAEFYEDLWQTLIRTGHWQGEIWNRREDGEIILASTHIDAVLGEGGQILHFICGQTDSTRLKSVENHVEYLISHDPLTGLMNRSSLEHMGDMIFGQSMDVVHETAVMFLDIDRFKEINESLGHAVGDELLIQVAKRLKALTRITDIVSRVGGDEFGLVFPGLGRENATAMAEKIQIGLRVPFGIDAHHFNLSASIGVAIYPDDGDSIGELLKNADTALYRAKLDGRNISVFYERSMNEATYDLLMLEAELREALAKDQLVTYYQPKLGLRDAVPIGAEALVRWQHPTRGLVSPGEFIPVAERSSLINEIGVWVLNDVCRQLASWRDDGCPIRPVAVNLSARQFQTPTLPADIARLLEKHGLAADMLELELTESTLLKSHHQVVENLSALQRMGLGLAIDDFGTGYSSLSYLKRMPISVLKIDQSFVRDLETSADDQALVKSIISLGRSFRLKTVAEGVETEVQASFLRQQGCDFGQGYLFARPMPAAEYAKWFSVQALETGGRVN